MFTLSTFSTRVALIDHVGSALVVQRTGPGSTWILAIDSRRACEQCTNADLLESSPCDEDLKFFTYINEKSLESINTQDFKAK